MSRSVAVSESGVLLTAASVTAADAFRTDLSVSDYTSTFSISRVERADLTVF